MKNEKIKRMTGIALLMALVFVMQALGGVIPPVGGFTISLVLIPIVIGAALYGPNAGALLGATFGVIVFINCVTGADPGGAMVLQANPILCFLVVMAKGTLAGFCSGLFIVCMLTFFREVLSVWASGGDIIAYVLSGLVLANFVPELLINVVFSPFGQRIVHTVKGKK